MKSITSKKLGLNSNLISPPLTVSTSKCRANALQQLAIILNAAVGQTEDRLYEATIGALANLVTETAAHRCVVATLTEANARLVKQLEDNSNELRELKALINK
jgi:hypothetical protein